MNGLVFGPGTYLATSPVLAEPEVRLSTTVRHTVLTVAYCCMVPVAKT